MTKPIHLNHAAAATAVGDVKALVTAMMANTERLRGFQKALETVMLGAFGDQYQSTMTNYNNDLTAYDTQVQKLNGAVEVAALEIQRTDHQAGQRFAGLGRS
ncbi:hypothetical protein [Nocardia vinacea]|uniref:hypothetical protein n=1 Tax=Nocardia vinacea TaxID=96468 RepID=UPI0003091FDD|nr:hypothetical protein [Nocardia vinacea]